ncbi:uncharacterized protein TRAVEDRAFT_174703 [Trametes versicolor FP-101664 SS1]|uniref:uncharacterized protein n=1 Tax=Trametes versicolor (strain FP-101664) TaxID=717944 RepID=UPI00046246BC|nr:uncharacterized protein TRAVEDRAFT_174703 [Trametes versicolor FP-101664 SS1]EIW52630.1 hypothetical protein TRAVEDRAFT_174703 [Trametes versicolor FP-101664 SS1]
MASFPPRSSLLRLPEELRIEVLKHLDVKSLIRCRLVCAALRDLVKESLQLQYNIELAADGLVDGTGSSLSVAERYKLLLERRRRWRYLDWKRVDTFSAPAACQAYELVDGVFASSRGFGFLGSRHLAITRLPTLEEGVQHVERDDIGFTARDFAMDPSQDLIALVLTDGVTGDEDNKILVRLHTLSGNRPHPEAAIPELSVSIPSGHYDRAFIQVFDDVVGMFFWMHDPALVIWNWRTGKIVVNCVDSGLPSGAYDCSFLSSRAYMITTTAAAGAIAIYTFSGDVDASSSPAPPTHVAQLQLPPVKPGQDPIRFYTHSAPSVARPTPGRPFETSGDCRLHVMELNYGERTVRFNLFLRSTTLLAYIPPGVGSGASFTPAVKAWDEWGPDNTRFWPIMGGFQWLRYVHGERIVLPAMIHGMPILAGTTTMMMYDFHVHPKRLDDPCPLTLRTDSAIADLVTEGTPIVADAVFVAPVVTRLPFMMVRKQRAVLNPDYSGFMIDHEHLVGMRDVDLDIPDMEFDSTDMNVDVFTF